MPPMAYLDLVITYISPHQQALKPRPQRTFKLELDGVEIGGAEVNYFSRPLPLYELANLWVDYDYHGHGYGRRILQEVMSFLKKRRRPGILMNAIKPTSHAYGMYARHGWVQIPNSTELYVYNPPKHAPLSLLASYSERQTTYNLRQSFKEE